MKKKIAWIVALVMVIVAVLTVSVACNNNKITDDQLNKLLRDLRSMHVDEVPSVTDTNYNVRGKIVDTAENIEVYVKWTSDSDKITISTQLNSNNYLQVTIPDRSALTADLPYNLTATLVDAEGKEYKDADGKEFSFTVSHTVTKYDNSEPDAVITFNGTNVLEHGADFKDSYGNLGYEYVTWQENDITVKSVRGESFNGSVENANPARFYTNSTIEISYTAAIKAIRLTVDTGSSLKYAKGFDGLTADTATFKRVDDTVLIVLTNPATTFVTPKLASQTRIYKIEIFTNYVPTLQEEIRYNTTEEIIAALKQLAPGETLPGGAYTLTGTVTEIGEHSDQYSETTVTIAVADGNGTLAIECYMLKDIAGVTLAVGDEITVTGVLKNYDNQSETGKLEFDLGCTYVKGGGGSQGGEDPDPATHPSAPASDSAFTVLSQPAAGTYKLAMKGQDGSWHYITGEMSTYYYETVTDAASAADVELVADGNGWLLKCGSKYIEIELNGTHINAVYKDARTADKHWTWDSVSGAFVWEDGANKYFLGNHDSYTSIGGCDYTNHADNYMAVLGTPGSGSQGGGDEGGGSTGGDVTPTGNVIKITGDALGLSGKYSDGSKAVNGVTVNWKELMLGNSNYAGAIQVRIEKAKDESGNQAKDDNGNPIKKEGGGVSEIWAECGKKIEKIELVIKGSAFDNEACWLIKFGTGTNYTSTQTLNTVKGTTTYTITPDGDYTSFDLVYNWLKNTGYYAEINIYLAD